MYQRVWFQVQGGCTSVYGLKWRVSVPGPTSAHVSQALLLSTVPPLGPAGYLVRGLGFEVWVLGFVVRVFGFGV